METIFCIFYKPSYTNEIKICLCSTLESALENFRYFSGQLANEKVELRGREMIGRSAYDLAVKAAKEADFSDWVLIKEHSKLSVKERLEAYIKNNLGTDGEDIHIFRNDSVENVVYVAKDHLTYKVHFQGQTIFSDRV